MDIHNHFVPPELVADARRGQGYDGVRTERIDDEEWLIHRQGFRYPLHRAFYDVEARLAAMDEQHTDIAVMSIAPPLFMYWTDPAGGVDFCRQANDALAEFARGTGGRVTAVATLPMQDPGAAVKELRRTVGELGLPGAEIGPRVEDLSLTDETVVPVLAAAEELGVPLILHPYNIAPRPGLPDFYLSNLVGNPLETTVCAARLIFSGTLDRLGDLALVLMHGGGYLPYQIGRLDHGNLVRPESRGCAGEPSGYLRRFHYDTITHAPRPLRFLVDTVGADRVVFGTDFPYDMAAGPFDDQVEGVGLTDAERAQVAGGNAAALFGIDVPEGRS